MKKLLVLLIIWLGLTLYLSYDILQFKQFKEDNLGWRAFLVYSNTLSGCMMGVGYSNPNYNFVNMYSLCLELAYKEKYIYEEKWKK